VKFGTAVYRGYREYRPSLIVTDVCYSFWVHNINARPGTEIRS